MMCRLYHSALYRTILVLIFSGFSYILLSHNIFQQQTTAFNILDGKIAAFNKKNNISEKKNTSIKWICAKKDSAFVLNQLSDVDTLFAIQSQDVLVRGDTTQRKIALIFSGNQSAEGLKTILLALKQEKIKASFFLSSELYRTKSLKKIIQMVKSQGHYLGANVLNKDDSMLLSKEKFLKEIDTNFEAMLPFGLNKYTAPYFLLPHESYNYEVLEWTKPLNIQPVTFTYETLSNKDNTVPNAENYHSSDFIYQSIINKATDLPTGLNGSILLFHIGTPAARTDKFYHILPLLLQELISMGYKFVRIDSLLKKVSQ